MSRRTVAIALLVGWQEHPFYYDFDDPEEYGHSIEEAATQLQLPAGLVREIKSWDAEYQATYQPDDFSNSGFPGPDVEQAWVERGKVLAARIKRDSPIVASVDYQANGVIPDGGCVF